MVWEPGSLGSGPNLHLLCDYKQLPNPSFPQAPDYTSNFLLKVFIWLSKRPFNC